MTEWWVSQAKHWCDICKVWHGGHIQQILKHRSGRMHQEREEAMLKASREREKEKQQSDKDLLSQLAQIERAAANAMLTGSSGPVADPRLVAAAKDTAAMERAAQCHEIELTVEAAKRRRLEHAGGATGPVSAATGSTAAQPLPAAPLAASAGDWTAHVNPGSGHAYYYNRVTQESRWQPPPEFLAAAAAAAAQGGGQPQLPLAAPGAAVAAAAAPGAAAAAAAAAAAPPTPVPQAAVATSPAPAPQATTPSAGGSPWVVVTDPGSGHLYYYNSATGTSSWERPPDLAVDLSKPPPPPTARKPPPPPKRGAAAEAAVGGWEEVRPEDSMWGRPEEVNDARGADSDEDEPANPLLDTKAELMGRRGHWAVEDLEVHEKVAFVEKKSISGGSNGKVGFPIARKRAAGIRKRGGDDD
mmetsp:Transcript_39922/g.126973  ORF Transcript_39922/g.126973 Transcript_39922/m.126973 type:complete len:414 (+) Transcript_39922:76-1317(+)